jgi:hypothetical protein
VKSSSKRSVLLSVSQEPRLILPQAKDLGNYHPTIKRLLSDPDKSSKPKKRERGLGMGVGSFRGGILTLGKQEIQNVQGSSSFKSKSGSKRSSRR